MHERSSFATHLRPGVLYLARDTEPDAEVEALLCAVRDGLRGLVGLRHPVLTGYGLDAACGCTHVIPLCEN